MNVVGCCFILLSFFLSALAGCRSSFSISGGSASGGDCGPGNGFGGTYCCDNAYRVTCNAGYYLKSNSLNCECCRTCGLGICGSTTCNEQGSAECQICTAGKYSTQGASACQICTAGKYSTQGASACESCPAGKYNPSSGSTSSDACLNCDPVRFM